MADQFPQWDGKAIAKAGAFSGIPMDAYHGQLTVGPSISSSGLRTIFTKSPAHYFDQSYLNPERAEEEDTEAFVLGRAAHHLLLGEDDFSTLFIAGPEELGGKPWQGNRTECRAWIAAQQAAGRTVLKPDQIEQIRGMAKTLAKHPLIESGILNGHIEKSLVWKDKETGVWLKARPDAIPNDSGDVADLKTTIKAGFDFDNDGSKMRYDMQAALTKWGMKEVLGLNMASFSFVPVLKSRPHCCDVLTLQGDDIEQAEKDLRVAIRVFANCLETGNWFGPSGSQSDARFFVFSPYQRERAQFRRDFLEREIAFSAVEKDLSQLDYAGTP